MPLSDRDIFKEIEIGNLVFDPVIELNQVSASSVDLRLADVFTIPKPPGRGVSITIDPSMTSAEDVFNEYAREDIVPSGGQVWTETGRFRTRVYSGEGKSAKQSRRKNRGSEFDGEIGSFRSSDRSHSAGQFQRTTQTGNIQRRALYRVARTRNSVLSTDSREAVVSRSVHECEPISESRQFCLNRLPELPHRRSSHVGAVFLSRPAQLRYRPVSALIWGSQFPRYEVYP